MNPLEDNQPPHKADAITPIARPLLRYGVAILAVLIAAGTRAALGTYIEEEAPFLLMLGAVMVAAWYGGPGPGLAATALAALISSYYFLQPVHEIVRSVKEQIRIGAFVLQGVIITVFCATLHTARRRAEASAAEARELERAVARVSDAEQTRIGHDLHDGLGQVLTGVSFLTKRLHRKLVADNRPEAADAAEVAQLVNESIGWTRDLARGLSPVDLDRTSLPAALRSLAAKTERICSVRCTCEGDDELELPDDATALNFYRVAQEAVNNAIKHGRARHVRIELAREQGRTRLSIEDDGVGLALTSAGGAAAAAGAPANGDGGGNGQGTGQAAPGGPTPAGGKPQGMGMKIMRYRTRAVGAALEVTRGARGGTVVRCTQPTARTGPAGPAARAHHGDDDHAA